MQMVTNMKRHFSPLFCLLLISFSAVPVGAATLSEADQLFQRGSYREAVRAYLDVEDNEKDRGVVGASRVDMLTGEYEKAEQLCRDIIGRNDARKINQHPLVATQLAEVLFDTGRSDQALALLKQVVDSTDVPLRALVKYAQFLDYRGRKEEAQIYATTARASFDSRINVTSDDLAMVALSHWLSGNFREANQFFREATTMDASNIEAKTLWGDLLEEKFNTSEAQLSYQEVLQINPNYVPAIVGLARANGDRRLLERALFTNPKSVKTFVAFAEMAIVRNKWAEADSYLEAAIGVNPEALSVIIPQAGIAILTEDEARYKTLEQRALAIRPVNGEFYSSVAQYFGNDYRFKEAVEFARKAIAVEPDYWQGHTVLGMNLVRLGQEEEGRKVLEEAFDNDSYNLWTSNMLKVFDTLDDYVTVTSEHFTVRLNKRDSVVLWPFLKPLLEEAWRTQVKKYGFTPEGPVLVEVFNKTEDFAVRSVGLPDIGPLVGICFGKVITLISPDTLAANWQEIAWHEFAHIITLQMTRNRIPRWLSEGISVYEEHQGRPEWGRHQDLDLVRAVQQDKLLPVENINDAFLSAQSDEDLSFAYLESSLVVDFIVAKHGFGKLKQLVQGYNAIDTDDAIFSKVFQQSMTEFNQNFSDWINEHVAALDVYVHQEDAADTGAGHGHGVRNNSSAILAELYNNESIKEHMRARIEKEPRDFQAHLQLGIVLFKEDNYDEAEKHLLAAKAILPEYTSYPSPPLVLSQIYQERGETDKYLKELEYITKFHQHQIDANITLADSAMTRKDYKKAEYHLNRAIAVDPYRTDVHRKLAAVAQAQNNHAHEIREYTILAELDTTDPVQSYTNLARAYLRNGENKQAKQQSLLALEIAPTYEPAQTILLEAVGEGEQVREN